MEYGIMVYKKLGRSNVKVSRFCLGTGNFREIDRIFPPPQPLFYNEQPPLMSAPSWN
jgi:hypothetical protein